MLPEIPRDMGEMDHSEPPLRVSFIKCEGPRLHRAFSVPADYDRKSDRFIAPRIHLSKPGSQLPVDLRDLQAAILEFQESFPHSTLKLDAEKCTWEDVFAKLQETNASYNATDESGIGYLGRIWRKAGKNADTVDPWLDFIPDEYGLNFVRAGIVVILQLAKRTVEHRERVQEATVQVIDAVTRAISKRKILSGEDSLKDCIHKLYMSVLRAVTSIIQYLLRKIEKSNLSKKFISTFNRDKGNDLESKNSKPSLEQIDCMVKSVQGHADKFTRLYMELMDEMFVHGYSLQLESRESLRQLGVDTYRNTMISTQIRDFVNHLPVIKQQNQIIKNDFNQLRDDVKAEFQAREEKFKEWAKDEWARDLMNFVNELFRSQEKRFEQELQRVRLMIPPALGIQRSQTPAPRPALLVSPRELIDMLQIPISAPNDDLDIIMMEKSWFKEHTLAVAEALFETRLFCQWFAVQSSGILLADGYDEDHATDAISSMSFVCLSLIGNIISARRDREVVVYFFCGLHCDPNEGPRFMIRSLIMQLLLALQLRRCLNLSFIDNIAYLQDLQHYYPQALVFILQGLVQLFPAETTVYCVIDGVDWFERDFPGVFKEDMLYFSRALRDLARPRPYSQHYDLMGDYPAYQVRCRFKVLLTSANGTDSCWEQIIHPLNRVSLGSTF